MWFEISWTLRFNNKRSVLCGVNILEIWQLKIFYFAAVFIKASWCLLYKYILFDFWRDNSIIITVYSTENRTAAKCCSLVFISIVARDDIVRRLKIWVFFFVVIWSLEVRVENICLCVSKILPALSEGRLIRNRHNSQNHLVRNNSEQCHRKLGFNSFHLYSHAY